MTANARQIIVIGAGIGGLASALALQRRGFRVAVYERAPEIREIGAGVVIAPNARRALLRRACSADDVTSAAR